MAAEKQQWLSKRAPAAADAKRQGLTCTFGGAGKELHRNIELADLEVFRTVRVDLVDNYFVSVGWVFPPRFQAALRTAASLHVKGILPKTKALLAAVVALSARSTSHPLIIGNGSPAMLSTLQLGYDHQVLAWREATCTALTNQAIQIANESGAFQRAGIVEALVVGTLMLLPSHGPQRRSLYLIYREHESQLQEYGTAMEELDISHLGTKVIYSRLWGIGLGWMVFLREARIASEVELPSLYCDEAVAAFSESVVVATGCRGPTHALSRSVFDMLRCAFELLLKGLRLAVKVSLSIRRAASPDMGRVAVIHAALDEAFLLRSRAAMVVAGNSQVQPVHTNIGLAASVACHLTLSLEALLRPFLGLDAWQVKCRTRSLRECRCVVEAFMKAMEDQIVQGVTTMGSVMRPMWDRVADCMLGAPVTESPGKGDMTTWTMIEKKAEITSAAQVLEAYAWSWPEVIPTLQKLQGVLPS